MLSNKVKNMKIDLILIKKFRIQILSHTRISAFFAYTCTANHIQSGAGKPLQRWALPLISIEQFPEFFA